MMWFVFADCAAGILLMTVGNDCDGLSAKRVNGTGKEGVRWTLPIS
jgi:hypothetical protein